MDHGVDQLEIEDDKSCADSKEQKGVGGKRRHRWACWQCTLVNESSVGVCEACGAPENVADKGWNCSKCTYLNVKEASRCSVCGHRQVIVIE